MRLSVRTSLFAEGNSPLVGNRNQPTILSHRLLEHGRESRHAFAPFGVRRHATSAYRGLIFPATWGRMYGGSVDVAVKTNALARLSGMALQSP